MIYRDILLEYNSSNRKVIISSENIDSIILSVYGLSNSIMNYLYGLKLINRPNLCNISSLQNSRELSSMVTLVRKHARFNVNGKETSFAIPINLKPADSHKIYNIKNALNVFLISQGFTYNNKFDIYEKSSTYPCIVVELREANPLMHEIIVRLVDDENIVIE